METDKLNRWRTLAANKLFHRIAGTAIVLIILALISRGGHSSALPAPLSETERNCINSTHFPITVGVANYRHPVYSNRLVGALRATGLFDGVELLDVAPNADVVARVNRAVYGTPKIPVAYLLTFGIVHSTVVEEWGEVFSLHSRKQRHAAPIRFEFVYEGPTTLGLAGRFFALSSSQTTANPRETQRFHDALAASICVRADEIRRAYADKNKFQIPPPVLPGPDKPMS